MCVFCSFIASQAFSSSSLFNTSSNWARANKICRASAATLKDQNKHNPPPLIYHFTLTLQADMARGSPRYVERSSVFVVLFSCRDADTGPQSEHEAGEELRKQTDHRLLALTI